MGNPLAGFRAIACQIFDNAQIGVNPGPTHRQRQH